MIERAKMLIFWDDALVFLATPKAGSTAVEVALESLATVSVQRPPQLKHVDAEGYNQHIRPWIETASGRQFTTVALIRSPIEWLQSWYRFWLRDHDVNDAVGDRENTSDRSFEAFARAYLDDPAKMTDGCTSQSAFLECEARPVDRIFRYEHMEQFIDFLDEHLGCEISLPRINVPPAVDVSLSDKTQLRLKTELAADFELYARVATTETQI